MTHLSRVLLSAGCACGAIAAHQENAPDVRVYLKVDQSIGASMMERALLIAATIFRDIGVEVAWSSGRAPARTENAAQPGPVEMNLHIVQGSGGIEHEYALAYALPYAPGVRSITVLYDRIEPTVLAWPALGPTLLAHVFAHEIAHVLGGSDMHAATGLMKAHWTRDDFWNMSLKPLRFTPADVALIRQGLAAHASRAANIATRRT